MNSDTTSDATDALVETTFARPQPCGIFPLPAGYLLLPTGYEDLRHELVAGKRPTSFPDELAYYRLALDGDAAGALAAITGSDLVDDINRFVLDSSTERLLALYEVVTKLDDATPLMYVDTLAFITGLRMVPPDVTADVDGEFAALAHAACATAALERADYEAAIEELELGAQHARTVSTALMGLIMGQMAQVQLTEGGIQRAGVTFQAALDALAGTDLIANRAELLVAAGAMYQEMSEAAPRLMQQAISHYHEALLLIDASIAPETYAIANANLAHAYLTMPMNDASDQLRTGIAVQCLRTALEHFTPDSHPDRWSSTQLNLANALVYLPSSHQADNIMEAVELYEKLLEYRTRDADPLGRARVLSNQGNALAHLGAFDDASARLHEARTLFEEFEETAAIATVLQLLDEIAKQQSANRGADQ